jgi:hypothetical protein
MKMVNNAMRLCARRLASGPSSRCAVRPESSEKSVWMQLIA